MLAIPGMHPIIILEAMYHSRLLRKRVPEDDDTHSWRSLGGRGGSTAARRPMTDDRRPMTDDRPQTTDNRRPDDRQWLQKLAFWEVTNCLDHCTVVEVIH